MVECRWVPLRVAWQEALYGPGGFYRTRQPADHFRTSAHVSPTFARAVVELARRRRLTGVCDLGAGGGELLATLHRIEPSWTLVGVEVRPRPPDLPKPIEWRAELPRGFEGLVFGNELLDNIACDVVQLSTDGRYLVVEVDRATGEQRLGPAASNDELGWLSAWWPLTEEGDRAEVGLTRDALWTRVCAANPASVCVAVDYGHLAARRPAGGSLSSYRLGRQTPVTFDGYHDITAHVAFDSLAASVGGTLRLQREVLHDLGVRGSRPPLSMATTDPAAYLRELATSTESAELIEGNGLGGFFWLSSGPTPDVRP